MFNSLWYEYELCYYPLVNLLIVVINTDAQLESTRFDSVGKYPLLQKIFFGVDSFSLWEELSAYLKFQISYSPVRPKIKDSEILIDLAQLCGSGTDVGSLRDDVFQRYGISLTLAQTCSMLSSIVRAVRMIATVDQVKCLGIGLIEPSSTDYKILEKYQCCSRILGILESKTAGILTIARDNPHYSLILRQIASGGSLYDLAVSDPFHLDRYLDDAEIRAMCSSLTSKLVQRFTGVCNNNGYSNGSGRELARMFLFLKFLNESREGEDRGRSRAMNKNIIIWMETFLSYEYVHGVDDTFVRHLRDFIKNIVFYERLLLSNDAFEKFDSENSSSYFEAVSDPLSCHSVELFFNDCYEQELLPLVLNRLVKVIAKRGNISDLAQQLANSASRYKLGKQYKASTIKAHLDAAVRFLENALLYSQTRRNKDKSEGCEDVPSIFETIISPLSRARENEIESCVKQLESYLRNNQPQEA